LFSLLCRHVGAAASVPLLAQLPSDTPLSLVAPLLGVSAESAANGAAAAATTLALHAVDHAVAARTLVGKQSKYVTMEKNPPAVCAVCGRRMAAPGTLRPSPAAVFREGRGLVFAHSACYKE
jgi:hypothetical protein